MRKLLAILLIVMGTAFGGAGVAAAQPVPSGSSFPAASFEDEVVEMWAELVIVAIGQDEWDRITGDGK